MVTKRVDFFKGSYFFLSNFFVCPFEWRGYTFPTAEHAFQAAKTTNYDDFELVVRSESPSVAKKNGRKVTLRSDWEETKIAVMASVLEAKFSAGSALADQLLATGQQELVEGNNWGDRFWGVDTNGQNYLGRLLMSRRSFLLASESFVELTANIWDLHLAGFTVVIPTNCQVRSNGTAVMGAGLAKQASARFAGLDVSYGKLLVRGETCLYSSSRRVLLVPTKNHYKDSSDLLLVEQAVKKIRAWGVSHTAPVAVPLLGCGLGGLGYADVKKVVDKHLKDTRGAFVSPC